MSAIDDKHESLEANGRDLGAPQGPEEDAEAGGRVRRYEHGTIYWSNATGAHMVGHGIHNLYLQHGGPGTNPATGQPGLGYPTSDEELVPYRNFPRSRFERGSIYWTPGTGGCVIYGEWGDGVPISGNIDVAGGQAVYFERGVAFSARGAVPSSTVSWSGV